VKAPNAPQSVKRLFQDHIGRLWVGSTTGVTCFDGNRFFDLRAFGYPETEALSIAEDDVGGIWIGSRLGLHRWFGGALTRILQTQVNTIVRGAPGIMIAGVGIPSGAPASSDVYRIRALGREWKAERLSDLKVFGVLLLGRNKTVSFGSRDGWLELSEDVLRSWTTGAAVQAVLNPLPGMNVEQVFRDRAGCVWFRNSGYTTYQCGAQPRQDVDLSVIGGGGIPMTETNDGQMLLAGANTLAIGRPGSWRSIRAANGLPQIQTALMTNDGSIWVGGAKGLFRMAYPFRLEYWNERDGLADVMSTLRVAGRTFAADSDGIKELSRERRSWAMLPKLPSLGSVWHMLAGPAGTIYATLYYHDVEQIGLDGAAVNGIGKDVSVTHMAQTSDGALWVTGMGVARVRFVGGRTTLVKESLPGSGWNALDIETNPSKWRPMGLFRRGANQEVSYRLEGDHRKRWFDPKWLPFSRCRHERRCLVRLRYNRRVQPDSAARRRTANHEALSSRRRRRRCRDPSARLRPSWVAVARWC
jgi:hypothetical protein